MTDSKEASKETAAAAAAETKSAEGSLAPKLYRVTVFGDGTLFARRGHKVCILTRRENRYKSINENHKNEKYLTEYTLHDNITAELEPAKALAGVELIVHSIPVQSSFVFLNANKDLIPADVPIISLSKGIHSEKLTFMNDIIVEALERKQPMAFLSGPSFAKELMDEQPTGLVCASSEEKLAKMVQEAITGPRIRVYTTTDVVGVEVGGALKNIYAIGAGMAEGMGFRLNTAALLVTRGCSEMRKLAVALGARADTLAGLSGIGDLMLTCFGGASRNRSVGVRLGKGEKLEDILASMSEVAEGVATAAAASKLIAKLKLDLPLSQAVAAILAGKATVRDTLSKLMTLPAIAED